MLCRRVDWEGGDGPKERDKKARGRELARDFFSIYREDVGDCLEFSQCLPSLSPPLFMLGFILPDTVCRRRVPLAIKGQLLAVRHEILVN